MNQGAEFRPPAGVAQQLAPGLRRILAPNPSPMTWRGTNTYLIGDGHLALIDPGPDLPAHNKAIMAATGAARIEAIFVSHSHVDHSPMAASISKATGAPVLAFGDAQAGRSQIMTRLVADGMTGGGEGVDPGFRPDQQLRDGEIISGKGWSLQAIWTPGHMGNHMCFAYGDALFTGDHVMGWASSLVSPPDGDLTQFMASCHKLAERSDQIYYPGHGAPVSDPAARIAWLIDHRLQREAQIMQTLGDAAHSLEALTQNIYTDTPPALQAAARRNVLAHLIDLSDRGLIAARGNPLPQAMFSKC